MSFEWRTDEDDDWQEGVKQDQTAVSQSFLQRRWRFLLVALMGIAAVWLAVQWQINQRVTTATVEVESELLNTHNFVLQTVADQDEDLFKSNLSGRDPTWGEVQKTLLNEGMLLDRSMLGWQHMPAPAPLTEEEVTVTLDPTFNAAELLYPQTYAVQTPASVTETVTLQHTAVYRLGERRWLYSPPLDDFWGDWITQGGDYLTVVYPERDREVAARLAIHLDRLVSQMCAELADLNCDSDLRFHLRLDTDPGSLLEMNEIETTLTTGQRLELPTPTLIGLPTDDASYEVLYQAYRVQLATAVLAHQIEYDCCRHELFFRALRDYQLAELELQAWPLNEAMYSQILAAGFDGDILRHWTRRWEEAPPQFLQVWVIEDPEPIWQQVYMLIEFLAAQETAVSPTDMMRLMDRNSYDSWLADVLGNSYEESLVETRFLEYIYQQTSSGQQPEPPIPLPSGSITLICPDLTNGPRSKVFAYDLVDGTWQEQFAGRFSNATFTTSDGENFVVTEYGYKEPYNSFKVSLVTKDETRLLEDIEIVAQNEHWINYYLFETADYRQRYEYNEGETSTSLLPVDCPSGNCPAVPLDNGWPIFSPNREQILVRVPPDRVFGPELNFPFELQNELYLMSLDEQVRQPIGQGGIPFWLTNDTYGMVIMRADGWELLTAVISRKLPRFLLGEVDLLDEFATDERPDGLLVNQIVVNPTNPQELLLQVRDEQTVRGYGPATPSFLFELTLTADLAEVTQIELLRKETFTGSVGYSADGRFILQGDFGSGNPEVMWHFMDRETGNLAYAFASLSTLTGTPDGQWYVQYSHNYLLLHAPAYNYHYFVRHNLEDCQRMALSVDE